VFTEMPDNPGTSVTNFIERLATMVYYDRLAGLEPQRLHVLERYPSDERHDERVDFVNLRWDGQRFIAPKWRPFAHMRAEFSLIDAMLPRS
jgi:hypothetical protein